MSRDAVLQFFRSASENPDLQLQLRSITEARELLKLGRRNGFSFSKRDLAEATSGPASARPAAQDRTLQVARIPDPTPAEATTSRLLHYEWCFAEMEGMGDVVRELENLKIKPSTVDLRAFEEHFRQDDRDFADVSPASPGFRARHDEMMASERGAASEFARRSFHLINLDHHVEHELYVPYFRAKTRIISALERFFGDEVRFSGSMWYPPNGYRAWHTNETQPGWRMYLIDFDATGTEIAGKSFFRYMNPQTGDLVTLSERPMLMRFFKIEQEDDKLLWHCIVNNSGFNRWSFGFMVAESWMEKLL
jgi:hypothetical protein